MSPPDPTDPAQDGQLPTWLRPLARGARTIRAEDLTRFVPPAGSETRAGAVLMLFGEGHEGPDLVLTERSHDMRSHPGQISFPGGSLDPGETPVDAALREAAEEIDLSPQGVEVFGTLPQLWLPPSNFAVTPVLAWWREESPVRIGSPDEVESVLRVPLAALLDPEHRVTVTHPSGYRSPGFLIGPSDLVLWGFTAGIITRLFDHVGWTRAWDESREQELPGYMLRDRAPRQPDAAREVQR